MVTETPVMVVLGNEEEEKIERESVEREKNVESPSPIVSVVSHRLRRLPSSPSSPSSPHRLFRLHIVSALSLRHLSRPVNKSNFGVDTQMISWTLLRTGVHTARDPLCTRGLHCVVRLQTWIRT
ncbi:Uncharacterized protein Rs2_15723 [Raphanus sativus]|nr:Uncharacterized protein Rs2_15723 [Raphanus sativus]